MSNKPYRPFRTALIWAVVSIAGVALSEVSVTASVVILVLAFLYAAYNTLFYTFAPPWSWVATGWSVAGPGLALLLGNVIVLVIAVLLLLLLIIFSPRR